MVKKFYPSILYVLMTFAISVVILAYLGYQAATGDVSAMKAIPLTAAVLIIVNIFVFLSYYRKIPFFIVK